MKLGREFTNGPFREGTSVCLEQPKGRGRALLSITGKKTTTHQRWGSHSPTRKRRTTDSPSPNLSPFRHRRPFTPVLCWTRESSRPLILLALVWIFLSFPHPSVPENYVPVAFRWTGRGRKVFLETWPLDENGPVVSGATNRVEMQFSQTERDFTSVLKLPPGRYKVKHQKVADFLFSIILKLMECGDTQKINPSSWTECTSVTQLP